MILRNKRINKNADEIQLSVSYGLPDIKRMVQWLFFLYGWHNCDHLLQEKLNQPHTEQEMLEFFQNDLKCFGNFETKWAEQLSEWAFLSCIRNKFIIQSTIDENKFYFTELCIQKKPGRPIKN